MKKIITFAGMHHTTLGNRDAILYQTEVVEEKDWFLWYSKTKPKTVSSAAVWESTGDCWFASCAGGPIKQFRTLGDADDWVRRTMVANGVLSVGLAYKEPNKEKAE